MEMCTLWAMGEVGKKVNFTFEILRDKAGHDELDGYDSYRSIMP
jgi:hypothetical protein